ncbi:MAG: sigma-54 dependent transcriptional regulator [bacterium]|nr:sigma-54 dependent transcriptional regulator [bacterium]
MSVPQNRPIVIIEDEAALATALAAIVRRAGHTVVTCASARQGLAAIATHSPALIVLDIGLPDQNGLEVLDHIRAEHGDLPVLVITAHGNLQNAVDARKRGASNYLVKPIDMHEFAGAVHSMLDGPAALSSPASAQPSGTPLLIGSAPAMQPAFAGVAHACTTDVPVLLAGPSGAGKSIAAETIHRHSGRHACPFVRLSCANLPVAELERQIDELVGQAAGGTLYLDEVGELPPAMQVRLLRLIETGSLDASVGSDQPGSIRVVAATARDLAAAVTEQRFREDLLYRLRVLEIRIPPLTERMSDLPALCAFLLAAITPNRNAGLSEEALAALRRHDWPGNVRELRTTLEHACAVSSSDLIRLPDLPEPLQRLPGSPVAETPQLDAALDEWLDARLRAGDDYTALLAGLERRVLAMLLPRHAGKPTLLARALGMNRATLRRRLRDYGLAPDDGALE